MVIGKDSTSLCVSCTNILNCPRFEKVNEVNCVYHCNYYVPNEYPPEKALIYPFKTKRKEEKTKLNLSSEEKQTILLEILEKRKEERGMLQIFCKKCASEMDKVISIRHVFYRCHNYPNCKINADPLHVSQAVQDDEMLVPEFDKYFCKYVYDYDHNIIWVEELIK